ncbi:MAG TPA: hypothetical protein VLM39_02660, partial [Ignavibacteriaceae bacterium]|nr:hypothetical protein [Ignavibacteriaceae bacterium]
MNQKIYKAVIEIITLLFFSSPLFYAQTINAGSNQIINWEKTHSAELKGSVSSSKIKAEWTCPQNSQVVFKNASKPVTEVTFPRAGYYLLNLSNKEKGAKKVNSSVIVNVYRPNSYN